MTAKQERSGGNRPSKDLHGVPPDRVDAHLEQFLHKAMAGRHRQIEIVTGRGAGNRSGQALLRARVEKWLDRNKARFGIVQKQVTSKGGALLVDLRPPS